LKINKFKELFKAMQKLEEAKIEGVFGEGERRFRAGFFRKPLVSLL